MDDILTLEANNLETAEMEIAIARWIAQMAEMRKQMGRQDVTIEEASQETRAVLADITQILAELKAA